MDERRELTPDELQAAQRAVDFLDAAPSGAIVTDNGDGWPWVRVVTGRWKRDGIDWPQTSRQVVDWHLAALLDPDDDTDSVFDPVLMVPATRATG